MKRKAVWISCILTALFCGCPANASVIITLEQVGPNVVATARGTADLTDLTFDSRGATRGLIVPIIARLTVAGTSPQFQPLDPYSGISGPTTFGEGVSLIDASSGSFSVVGVAGDLGRLYVPAGYDSGTPLSAMATWNNRTIAGLGVTTGVYTWTWGSGANADSLKLFAGVPIPEPSTFMMLGAGLLPVIGVIRRRYLNR